MKFVIAGAGAVGAYVGAKMARAGEDVTLFARGPHLRAMQQHGLRVISAEGDFQVHPTATGDLTAIGTTDVVFLGVKAHSLTALAPQLAPLFGPDTVVVSMQNGVPWWFRPLERVDPGGVIAASIEPRRVVGSIVYFSTELAEPGVVRHIAGNRTSLGEPDGARSERCAAIARGLVQAGLRCPVTTHLRDEIWVKILGNVAFNPISVLTRKTLVEMIQDPDTHELVRNIMQEAAAVAERLGINIPVGIDQRIAGAEKIGAHKTSMLQDWEAGRPLELEAIVGAVLELGEQLAVPMPCTQAVYACTKLLAR
ncbi:MAG TPA: 2-dehydropantoate 2-reductase [Bryobacteraceae bacterium]|nr:2-dehydropantoate 2-reductase [Bryobacteraceae bacterium]